jgi:hypothetical protein
VACCCGPKKEVQGTGSPYYRTALFALRQILTCDMFRLPSLSLFYTAHARVSDNSGVSHAEAAHRKGVSAERSPRRHRRRASSMAVTSAHIATCSAAACSPHTASSLHPWHVPSPRLGSARVAAAACRSAPPCWTPGRVSVACYAQRGDERSPRLQPFSSGPLSQTNGPEEGGSFNTAYMSPNPNPVYDDFDDPTSGACPQAARLCLACGSALYIRRGVCCGSFNVTRNTRTPRNCDMADL